MKKITFSCIAAFLSLNAFATDYYFSASGNDSNNGKSVEKPLKSLSKVASINLKAGDKVLLKKGDVFYGAVELSAVAGKEGKPILISSYGQGTQKPVIDAKGKLNGILIEVI
ncbi:hypothetical protein [Flavobacterium sp. 7A]|uniref:hypothetical protein n=1 Tax=Flavobacterium sp. 7A TaxID=2940571 RepID=UPI00222733B9|nr:hypothetical protein [Flavobacterium sp. 7A]MCW2119358.1 hypothetical protein [Flavobacterium sp. 7A]